MGRRGIADRLDERLRDTSVKWDVHNSQALQLEPGTGYPQRLLAPLEADLRAAATGSEEQALVEKAKTDAAAWRTEFGTPLTEAVRSIGVAVL